MFTTTILTLALISFLQTDPIAAVRSAAERETIEAFGTAGLVTVQGIQLLDIDGDDFPEAFVRVSPTYRQTPTVIAYSFDKRTGPKRIMEALAPGRLRPTSGALRDSHASGEAADMTAGNAAKAPTDADGLHRLDGS